IDNRGHGESEKRYDTAAYGSPLMAEDARRLLDHLGIEKAHVIGYSMGARISAFLAQAHPERIASVTFGGLGYNMIRGMAGTGAIANALEAASIDDITNSTARTFRAFAEQTGSDLRALAACIRSSRAPITADALGAMQRPALVVVGSEDVIGGSAAKLAEVMPQADAVTLEGKDHMKAVGDAEFKAATLDFMARHDG
ncbi:MAG: alpha/beta fold hydrolase, partial [Pseudomonadota bacterium]